jgi:hypothetical protein
MQRITRCMDMVLVGFLALASVSWGEPGVTDTEIVIGSCAVLEGPASFLGTQTVLGAKAYINMIDDRSSVLHRSTGRRSSDLHRLENRQAIAEIVGHYQICA